MSRALERVRVIDLTQALAGPFCTQQLALMGAEVIRIEPPWGGYGTAVFGVHDIEMRRRLFGTNFGNKKNVTLNLRSEQGRDIFLALVRRADVVVQNFSPGTMEKLGLGYEVLKDANPRITYCALSGYGQTGPWKDKVAYDPLVQASTGFMSVNGYPDRGPLRVGPPLSDLIGGLYAAIGILTALHARETVTGEGQMIDCAMFDATFSLLQEANALSLAEGKPKQRTGNRHPFAVPCDTYETKDGKLEFIACQTDGQWKAIMILAGRQDIAEKGWNLLDRVKHIDEVDEIIGAWTKEKTRDELEKILAAKDVPAAPVLNMIEATENPHTKAREMVLEVADMYGAIDGIIGVAPKLLGTPGGLDWGMMERGAFNEEVYRNLLGLSEEEMDRYKEQGVI
jgi:crotonobetainyl-CoA:carnitine CoA-transferase CaiB-like acyl-CoA transferase